MKKSCRSGFVSWTRGDRHNTVLAAAGCSIRRACKVCTGPAAGKRLLFQLPSHPSADGHPIAGTIVFSVGSAQAARKADGAGNSAVSSERIIWAAALRWIFYLCTALAAGGVLFQLAVIDIPFALRPVLCSAAILGALLALLQIGIRGALLLDARALELLGAAPWEERGIYRCPERRTAGRAWFRRS